MYFVIIIFVVTNIPALARCYGGMDLDSEALQSLIPVSYHPGCYSAFPSGLSCWPCCVGRDVEAMGCKFGQVIITLLSKESKAAVRRVCFLVS